MKIPRNPKSKHTSLFHEHTGGGNEYMSMYILCKCIYMVAHDMFVAYMALAYTCKPMHIWS